MFRRSGVAYLRLAWSLLKMRSAVFFTVCSFYMLVMDAIGDHMVEGSVLKYMSCYGFECGEYRFIVFAPLGRWEDFEKCFGCFGCSIVYCMDALDAVLSIVWMLWMQYCLLYVSRECNNKQYFIFRFLRNIFTLHSRFCTPYKTIYILDSYSNICLVVNCYICLQR